MRNKLLIFCFATITVALGWLFVQHLKKPAPTLSKAMLAYIAQEAARNKSLDASFVAVNKWLDSHPVNTNRFLSKFVTPQIAASLRDPANISQRITVDAKAGTSALFTTNYILALMDSNNTVMACGDLKDWLPDAEIGNMSLEGDTIWFWWLQIVYLDPTNHVCSRWKGEIGINLTNYSIIGPRGH
jgi:hypothetical protein